MGDRCRTAERGKESRSEGEKRDVKDGGGGKRRKKCGMGEKRKSIRKKD